MDITREDLVETCAAFTGEVAPLLSAEHNVRFTDFSRLSGIGYSQWNELLLGLGYDRVTQPFFVHFFKEGVINSKSELEQGLVYFLRIAMLLYGNVKFAFKKLSRMDDHELASVMKPLRRKSPEVFKHRNHPLHKGVQIPAEQTFYLGYLVDGEIEKAVSEGRFPPDQIAAMRAVRDAARNNGRINHATYLCYDHLDVYIATSMRLRHEFYLVHQFCQRLFQSTQLKDLKLRYFDPTQAYCDERINKGLVEALMLKRARCTIYHAQELDTLGKDSELASTLAQGKPVICYVPQIENEAEFVRNSIHLGEQLYPELSEREIVVNLMKQYCVEWAWEREEIRKFISTPEAKPTPKLWNDIFRSAKRMYDRRAEMLRDSHPLALQTNLTNGVANGVLVVRKVEQCAALVRAIMLNELRFEIVTGMAAGGMGLREEISGCIYRYVSGDQHLTNSFWNFYLRSPNEAVPIEVPVSEQLSLNLL
ncbi:MAG: hypothetical protein K1X53_04550 [Candidatus Sumerlaeaceae bacterium]|nr:hypothetical protein [Candidatus Sumerlaeaceae bacterium]